MSSDKNVLTTFKKINDSDDVSPQPSRHSSLARTISSSSTSASTVFRSGSGSGPTTDDGRGAQAKTIIETKNLSTLQHQHHQHQLSQLNGHDRASTKTPTNKTISSKHICPYHTSHNGFLSLFLFLSKHISSCIYNSCARAFACLLAS